MADENVMIEGNDAQGGGNSPEAKTFTQEELDRILQDRIARERSKYGDYDTLKAQAGKLQALEDAQKTELQKAQEAAQRLQAERDAAIQAATDRLIQAAFIEAAAKHGVLHARDAFLLADKAGIQVTETGDVQGVDEAVKSLVDAGRLVLNDRRKAPPLDGGTGGGGRPDAVAKLTQEEIAIAQKMGKTPDEYARFKQ